MRAPEASSGEGRAPDRRPDLKDVLRTASWQELSSAERQAVADALRRVQVARDTNQEFLDARTGAERLADRMATIGGSWGFLVGFLVFLVVWVVLNSVLLRRPAAPDPYPYIFLNLLLSMLAALQAPIIMMSQNRQAHKDRIDAAADFQVNLKAELEVRTVQELLDQLVMREVPRLAERLQHIEALLGTVASGGASPSDRRPPERGS